MVERSGFYQRIPDEQVLIIIRAGTRSVSPAIVVQRPLHNVLVAVK